jgi:hypothetical protein
VISLDSPDWASLQHAYGDATDIPALLRQLDAFPSAEGNAEPWFTLWSALAHQGDVYPASFAAVPHIVSVLATSPSLASFTYFQFPVWVEICRLRHNLTVPEELSLSYFEALQKLGSLVCAASSRDWDFDFTRVALAAMAISKGFALMAEALLELDKASAEEFLAPKR